MKSTKLKIGWKSQIHLLKHWIWTKDNILIGLDIYLPFTESLILKDIYLYFAPKNVHFLISEKCSSFHIVGIAFPLPLALLSSAFHLSYNMLLNQLRSEDGNPENLLRNSFYQFQADRAIPNLEVSCWRQRLVVFNCCWSSIYL